MIKFPLTSSVSYVTMKHQSLAHVGLFISLQLKEPGPIFSVYLILSPQLSLRAIPRQQTATPRRLLTLRLTILKILLTIKA